ncbi:MULTISPECIES: acyltransferase family protein [unclassified Microbacterium]|uniref:acyltransferase family protein n=1 Tax=unclassified Microbacterium TaxID=2609290 RepID=UPI000EA8AAB5|nr:MULTISPECIES: acyltransferase family protein [unclassified Microbacterium]MBT2485402.1 acyltransferase [Microbacterium sp. ISL-108]RKN68204.1 acyltransferase [Microbacterium sp. CGR2]
MTTETSARTAAATGRAFRADIQGLRAIAVGLVLLYHAGVPLITGGYVGVDVFFVISGFLISTHLLESLQRDGRIRFADFYARRIRRILPASLTVAVLTVIAAVIFYPPLALERVLRDGLATILYVPNFWFAIQNTDYLADHSPSPFQHYWSLGVEEQFYLLWPVVLFLIFLATRRRPRLLLAAVSVIALASLVAGVMLTPVDQPSAFFLLPTRAWELLFGAIVGAILLQGSRPPGRVAAVAGWVGLLMILGSALLFNDSTAFPGVAAVLPTLGTALVIFAGASDTRMGPTSALSLPPLQFIGLISYSLYLVHWPLLVVTQAAVGEQNPLPAWMRVLFGIVIAIVLAWVLFRCVEMPLRAPRMLVQRRPRSTLLAALGVTVVLAVGVGAAVNWSADRLTGSGDVVTESADYPTSPPNPTAFVPSNMTPALQDVDDDLAPVFTDGCQLDPKSEAVQDCEYADASGDTRIVLFGDSHSAQWFPAVEEFARDRPGTSLRTYTKSSCSAAAATVLVKGVPYSSCDRWRSKVVEHLLADPPDLVVISNYAHYVLADSPDGSQRLPLWGEGLRATVQQLRDAGSEVLLIADSPRLRAAPDSCVSTDVMDAARCDEQREWAIDAELAAVERDVAAETDAEYVDFTEFICTDATCPVIIDDLFVYRDVNHMTSTFVSYLAPALEPTLASLLDVDPATAP